VALGEAAERANEEVLKDGRSFEQDRYHHAL
jgi:hypothetical protein